MLAERRREEILNLIESEGFIRISNLGRRFNVTDMTIRRDIDHLSELGLVRRVHGGAVQGAPDARLGSARYGGGGTSPASPADADQPISLATTYLKRDQEYPREKERIGIRAQELVTPGSTIIIDGGSTSVAFARHLDPGASIRVITHALNVACLLASRESCELFVPGGLLNRLTMTFSGREVERMYEELNADTAFLSASGLTLEKGLTDPTWLDASIKKVILRASMRVILLIDSHKFGLVSARTFARLDQVDTVVTDRNLPGEFRERYQEAGVHLILA